MSVNRLCRVWRQVSGYYDERRFRLVRAWSMASLGFAEPFAAITEEITRDGDIQDGEVIWLEGPVVSE